MNELTAFDVYNLVAESQFLVGSKVDHIYQNDIKDLYLQIYVKEKPKQLMRLLAGKCFYLTATKPQFPEHMQRFCAYLRKYILNARIKAIEQVAYERIIKIVFETKDGLYELYVELFGKGNFVVVKNNKIVSVAEEQLWADRIVKAGEVYSFPHKVDTKELFESQKKKGSTITMQVLDQQLSQQIVQQQKKSSAKEKEINRIKTIIEKQSEQLQKILKDADENKHKGELIYEHYQELQELLLAVQGSKASPEELAKKLKNNKLFKSIKGNELVVTL
jgi:predicted ribosome quality control (RQC) complex YloA/Tae2 family protein